MNNFILYKEMPIRSLYENSIFNAYRNDDIFLYSIKLSRNLFANKLMIDLEC